MNFEILKNDTVKNGFNKISYEKLLWTYEWLSFRDLVKTRDNETCTTCLKSQFKKLPNENFGMYFNLTKMKYEDSPSIWCTKKESDPFFFTIDDSVNLEVHHKYYILNKLPWEYSINALTTLCDQCHEKVHFDSRPVYEDETLQRYHKLQLCNRCSGKGFIPEFRHIQNGICFYCGGLGGMVDTSEQNYFNLSNKKRFL